MSELGARERRRAEPLTVEEEKTRNCLTFWIPESETQTGPDHQDRGFSSRRVKHIAHCALHATTSRWLLALLSFGEEQHQYKSQGWAEQTKKKSGPAWRQKQSQRLVAPQESNQMLCSVFCAGGSPVQPGLANCRRSLTSLYGGKHSAPAHGVTWHFEPDPDQQIFRRMWLCSFFLNFTSSYEFVYLLTHNKIAILLTNSFWNCCRSLSLWISAVFGHLNLPFGELNKGFNQMHRWRCDPPPPPLATTLIHIN